MTRAVELFCCAGGMALGFRRAGIEFHLAVDFDRNACDSYEHNLGRRPSQIDATELLRFAYLTHGGESRVDLLVADPPCTPWSRAGKRKGLADDRDMLETTVALVDAWRPTCWLVGNVPGLDDSTNSGAVQQTLGRLGRHYCIDYASLDAAAYGVPQHRVRPFWFGHPRGEACITWPQPTHGDVAKQVQVPGTELHPYVTVRDALSHLSRKQLGKPVRIRPGSGRGGHPLSRPDRPAGTIASSMPGNGGNVLAYGVGDHRPNYTDAPARTLTRNPMGMAR